MSPVDDPLTTLRDGNARFADALARGETPAAPTLDPARATGPQTPIAAVLACADARVPTELVFGQGLGDLFVVRVAGNAVGPGPLESLRYAVAALGVELIVVLGHLGCGAVAATLADEGGDLIPTIADRIRPAVAGLDAAAAVRANAEAAAAVLRADVHVAPARIVAAVYDPATGRVAYPDERGTP